jgi:hypothetical protein
LREDTTRFPQVEVKFDQQQPALSPILLHIRPHIDLLFSPKGQRLHTISIRRLRQPGNSTTPTILTLRYALHDAGEYVVLSAPNVVLRRANVNKVFGPTYQSEVLSFPGVWFAFEEDVGALRTSPQPPSSSSSPSSQSQDRNAEVKRIVVCQRSKDTTDALGELLDAPCMEGEAERVVVVVSVYNASLLTD